MAPLPIFRWLASARGFKGLKLWPGSNRTRLGYDRHHAHRPDRPGRRHAGADRAQRDASAQRHDAVADPGDLSDHQDGLWAGFRPDRSDHPDLPDHGLAVPAPGRRLYRQEPDALFDGRRHGLHPHRADRPRLCRQLWAAADLGGLRRARLLDLPPGSDPHGAQRLGRAARVGAGHLPGRRPDGRRAGAAARGLHHRAARAGEPGLVLGHGPARHGADDLDGRALCRAAAPESGGRARGQGRDGARGAGALGGSGRLRGDGAGHPAVLEERLFAELQLVLHLLPDREIRGQRADLAGHAVPVPGLLGGRRDLRGHPRRPDRPQQDHLVLDPGARCPSRCCCRMSIWSGPAC